MVDDDNDPDEVQRDDGDDGDDFPLWEGISPADFSFPESFFLCMVSISWRIFPGGTPSIFRVTGVIYTKEEREGPSQVALPVLGVAHMGAVPRGGVGPTWLPRSSPFG